MNTSLPTRPFLFLRHGQTDWNVEGRMQGHTDIPLNATGIAQAHAAAETLRGHTFTRIIASPLQRAKHTAQIIATAHNTPLEFCDQLKERTFGSVEGQLWHEFAALHNIAENQTFDHALPTNAEFWPQTMQRSQTAITHWLNTYPSDTLLFVGHGAFFRALYQTLGGPSTHAHNATPYHFQPTATGWQLITL